MRVVVVVSVILQNDDESQEISIGCLLHSHILSVFCLFSEALVKNFRIYSVSVFPLHFAFIGGVYRI